MDKQIAASAVFIIGGIVVAFMMLGDGTVERPKKLAGNSEACTYRAGEKDQEMVEAGGEGGRQIMRRILALERKCDFVTLVLADGTRHEMKLGPAGRKPGEKGPSSTGYELDY